MKVTRKDFVQAMTSNATIFAGVTRIDDLEYIRNVIHDSMQDTSAIREKRTCVARSHDLVFTGDSHLTLEHMDFYKLDCGNCTAFIAKMKDWNKSMVYVVE